jgi:hypothetical protein
MPPRDIYVVVIGGHLRHEERICTVTQAEGVLFLRNLTACVQTKRGARLHLHFHAPCSYCDVSTPSRHILVYRLSTGWPDRGSNPGGVEIFRNRQDRPWGSPSILYNGYRVIFPQVKRSGCGVNHSPPSSHPLSLHGMFYGELHFYHVTFLPLRFRWFSRSDRWSPYCLRLLL